MRKLILGLAGVALLAAGIAIYATWPSPEFLFADAKLRWDCPQSQPSQICAIRMRAMGHVWSAQASNQRAEYWYRRAADQGDASALFALGWIYETRALDLIKAGAVLEAQRQRVEKDMLGGMAGDARARLKEAEAIADAAAEAEQWYRKAADKGFAPAMNNLGELFRLGLGRDPDLVQAFKWYSAAARAGNPVGAWNLAIAYMHGDGVAHDQAEAERWLTWTPSKNAQGDLGWPVLERTTFFGSNLLASEVAQIRAAARSNAPMTLTVEAVKRNPALPSFHRVERAK